MHFSECLAVVNQCMTALRWSVRHGTGELLTWMKSWNREVLSYIWDWLGGALNKEWIKPFPFNVWNNIYYLNDKGNGDFFLLLLDKYFVLPTECLITCQVTKSRIQRGIRWFLPSKNSQPSIGKSIKSYMLRGASDYLCIQDIRKSNKRGIESSWRGVGYGNLHEVIKDELITKNEIGDFLGKMTIDMSLFICVYPYTHPQMHTHC